MTNFDVLRRQQFRRYYQPTRILLGLVPGPQRSGLNVITLCFTMTCSYKPPMVAFSIQHHTHSYELFGAAEECVLAVPGESLAQQTLFCGTRSGRDTDKVSECSFKLQPSGLVSVPSLSDAIANLELKIQDRVATGDHLTVTSLVQRFAVNRDQHERNLLSVGPEHDGYRVLISKGIHRIGVVNP